MEDFFFPISSEDQHSESNYWGGADADHTQIIGGGGTVKLLGEYMPHPPRVSAPLLKSFVVANITLRLAYNILLTISSNLTVLN